MHLKGLYHTAEIVETNGINIVDSINTNGLIGVEMFCTFLKSVFVSKLMGEIVDNNKLVINIFAFLSDYDN